jgi:hypothetical protein
MPTALGVFVGRPPPSLVALVAIVNAEIRRDSTECTYWMRASKSSVDTHGVGANSQPWTGFFEFQPAGGNNPPAVVVRYVTIAPKFQARKRKKVTYCPHVSTSYALGM